MGCGWKRYEKSPLRPSRAAGCGLTFQTATASRCPVRLAASGKKFRLPEYLSQISDFVNNIRYRHYRQIFLESAFLPVRLCKCAGLDAKAIEELRPNPLAIGLAPRFVNRSRSIKTSAAFLPTSSKAKRTSPLIFSACRAEGQVLTRGDLALRRAPSDELPPETLFGEMSVSCYAMIGGAFVLLTGRLASEHMTIMNSATQS